MRSFVFCISFLLVSFFSSAQEKEIDSILGFLERHTKQDTIRLDALKDLMFLYQLYDPHKGLVLGKEAEALADRLNDSKRLSYIYNNFANNYLAIGEDSLALHFYDKNIELNTRINNLKGIASTTFNKGIVYSNRSEYDKSIQCNKIAYAFFLKDHDSLVMAKILNSTGLYYMYLSENSNALKSFQQALNLYERLNIQQSVDFGDVLNNMGLLYKNINKLETAAAYYQRALSVFRHIGYKRSIANTLGNLGVVYDLLNNPTKAFELATESLVIYKEIGFERGIASSMTNLAMANLSLLNFEEALNYLNKSKAMYENWADNANLAVINNAIGETYMMMSNKGVLTTTKGYDEAITHFNQALAYSMKAKSLRYEQDCYKNLSEAFYKKGDYKNAFQAKDQGIRLMDSIFSMDKREEIVRMEERFKFDKEAIVLKAESEKKQALGIDEIKRQKEIKNGSIIGGSVLIGMILFGLIIYKGKRDAVSKRHEAEFESKIADTELKALRAQMNPHFIFNSLNSINDYITRNDVVSAQDYLTKFAKMMRQTLENSNQKEISLADDIKLLELYMKIEAIRLQHKFTYEIKIDKYLDKENTLIPPLMLQPCIENSIWHGISNKEGKGHITIEIKKQNGMMLCSVDDNGVGRQLKNQLNKKNSMGIDITKNRIEILNKVKDTHGSLKIIDKIEGVRIEILLPLQLAF